MSAPAGPANYPADAFHLVIPSIPGFGFSGPTGEAGWNTARVAGVWAELMNRLGYTRYGAQGGDTGAFVAPELGQIAPDQVVGVHVNAATYGFMPYGPVAEAELATFTTAEKKRLERLAHYEAEGSGYFHIQATRPQTLAYGLTDSPVGQLAWIVDIFKEWSYPAGDLPETAVDRDRLLTNVMLYWLTGTAGSAANIYYEAMHHDTWDEDTSDADSWAEQPGQTPTGVAVFAQDVAIRRYAEQSYNIVHWTEFDRGGHFAALEVPDLLVDDVRAFFRALRP